MYKLVIKYNDLTTEIIEGITRIVVASKEIVNTNKSTEMIRPFIPAEGYYEVYGDDFACSMILETSKVKLIRLQKM